MYKLFSINKSETLIPIILIAIFFNIVVIAWIIFKIGFPFVYPLDDTYIHMSIARTIAEHGVWGISPFDPASASSSPIYSIILAAFYLFCGQSSIYEYVPIGLNIIAIVACLMIWAQILSEENFSDEMPTGSVSEPFQTNRMFLLFYLLLLSVATPVFLLTVIGMEHSLHIAFATLFLYTGARQSVQNNEQDNKSLVILFVLSLLVVSIRFESILLFVPLIILGLAKKNYKYLAALISGVAIPLILFGLLWLHDGGWILPNSIMMKKLYISMGGRIPQGSIGKKTLFGLMLLSFTTLALSFYKIKNFKLSRIFNDWRVIFTLTSLFASAVMIKTGAAGWLYRYEAVFISLNLMSILIILNKYCHKRAHLLVMLALFVIIPYRTLHGTQLAITAPDDRRWEHLRPAQFISDFYQNQTAILNDIGLATWLSPHTRILDIVGLGNNDIAALRMENDGLTPHKTNAWAQQNNASIAILQICWPIVSASIPDNWILVSVWQGPRNVIFSDTFIGFFATDTNNAKKLKENLMSFSPPENVHAYFTDDLSSPFYAVTSSEIRHKGCFVAKKI